MSDPLLRLENLRVSFRTDAGTVRAVDGVDLEITAGETLGLVGESGCGKTVTALSILRLVPDPPGRIEPGSRILFRSDGGWEDLATASEARLRAIRGKDIAMIFQEPMTSLNPVLRIGDQIMEPLRLHEGLSRAAARARAAELLALVGIPAPEQRLDEYPHQLSGGMRQRVMIAMALACGPKLLIADEPTTALDVTIQAQILELLQRLQAEFGLAVLLITHDLGVVAEMCRRVVVMYAGQVVEEGPVEAVFADPQHPYTEGLLQALPRLGQRRTRLAVIPGAVPSPLDWPPGCRFAPRCPYAWEKPRQQAPPLMALGGGRKSRCWLVEEPERRAAVRHRGPVWTDAPLTPAAEEP